MKKILLGFFAFISVSYASAQFKVVGYIPSWTNAGDVNAIQYSKLTHINYAFILPTATGGLGSVEQPGKLSNLVSLAHQNGKKVLIAVGGWNNGDDGAFESLAGNASYRTNFANALINLINQYNLDGVDIDWEYPDNGQSSTNYGLLMQQLGTELHNRGKLLTSAVVGTGGASIPSSVFGVVDFLNLMAYDYNNYDHSTYAYAQQSLSYWKGRGLPASKAILGVPFYARPSWETYATLVNRGADPYADTYAGNYYNGINTIKAKTNLAWDQGGGIMIWELSGDLSDSRSLVTAINQVVIDRGGNNNPGNPGTAVTIEAENFSNMQGVQTEACSEGGSNVGWIDATDWMAWYNINFPTTGQYKVEYRVASLNGGGQLSLDLNAGSIQLGVLNVPNTGGWQNWTTISHTVTVNAGTYNLGVYAPAGGWNLNWIKITPLTGKKAVQASIASDIISNSVGDAPVTFNIAPNPVTSTLNLFTNQDLTGGSIRIFDVSGKEVVAKSATRTIDVSSLSRGVYTLIYTKGERKITKQFIK